jgi:hypothetical protein
LPRYIGRNPPFTSVNAVGDEIDFLDGAEGEGGIVSFNGLVGGVAFRVGAQAFAGDQS